ncbi:MAG TPA: fumarylacetoacetate hydrolase family protein [Alphaproteobacteria bacterium]|nr:fumarylacetoacetate hydrolase family protein [Alphaproteobacteria bacterium]
MTDLAGLARYLDAAARTAQGANQISREAPQLSLDDAYRIQALLVDERLARGERLIGVKMGFTSRAKMLQMGVSDLIWGRLTDAMRVDDGGSVDLARYIHPRVEPEVAFRLKHDLDGPVDLLEAGSAIDAVAPAIEIIDSRYKDFRFTLEDVVADNSSAAGFVVGPWCRVPDDLSNLGVVFCLNGTPTQMGSTAAILGHPLRSVVAAARLAAASGLTLQAGWTILAGAATSAEPLKPGDFVSLEVEILGRVDFRAQGVAKEPG